MKNVAFLLLFSLSGCGASVVAAQPTGLQDIENQFQAIPAPTAEEPLDEVQVPDPSPPDQATARTYRIEVGQLAPVSGILFTDAAAAYIVTEYLAQRERFQLALGQQRERDHARLLRDTEVLRIQMNGDRERFRINLESQGRYIANLEQVAGRSHFWDDLLKYVGIGATGILIGLVTGFLLAH